MESCVVRSQTTQSRGERDEQPAAMAAADGEGMLVVVFIGRRVSLIAVVLVLDASIMDLKDMIGFWKPVDNFGCIGRVSDEKYYTRWSYVGNSVEAWKCLTL